MAQRYQRSVVIDNDTGILQADERNEQADTGADGFFQGTRNGIDEPGAHLGECQDNEKHTFKKHRRKSELPGVAHAQANRVHEEGVQTHARSQGKRFLGIKGHHNRADNGRQGRCGKYRTAGHAVQCAEDGRVHGQDVGHGEEGGDTGQNLGTHAVLR